MSVKLLTEHHLEFLSLKGGCTGSSESTLVKMPDYVTSHVVVHIYIIPRFILVTDVDMKKNVVTVPVRYGGFVLFNNIIPHRRYSFCCMYSSYNFGVLAINHSVVWYLIMPSVGLNFILAFSCCFHFFHHRYKILLH